MRRLCLMDVVCVADLRNCKAVGHPTDLKLTSRPDVCMYGDLVSRMRVGLIVLSMLVSS